jgi:di/tricarboxylate transporter
VGGDAWLTLFVIAALVVGLALERAPASVITFGAVVVLLVLGVIDDGEAFAGFGNPAPITIAGLYVLAAAAEVTGALTPLTERAFGSSGVRRQRRELARICIPGAAASAFVANTPLVGMLAPRIAEWCRKTGRSASQYLMPLSYATVFGGVITVLGTSTNITVNGLMRDAGMPGFAVFEFTVVGLPIAVVGVALLILLAPLLLPERTSAGEAFQDVREYITEMLVEPGGPFDGVTIADGGLRHLEGVFLVVVERGGDTLAPVSPDETLHGGDRLVLAGDVRRVLDLQSLRGLRFAGDVTFGLEDGAPGQRFYEAVIGATLTGRTLREANFRAEHDAGVVAIHRAGERVVDKLGDVRLRLGDVLVLVAGSGLLDRWQRGNDFLLVSPLGGTIPVRPHQAWIAQLAAVVFVLLAVTNLLDLTQSVLVVACALVALRVVTLSEVRAAIDLNTVGLIAASFGIGNAVAASGLADVLGQGLVDAFAGFGDIGLLVGILLATVVATELLSNNAAAVLMFPIAAATAAATGLELRPLVLAILIAASCSFLTPVGYQTNTMVYGIGGYRFADFTRVGAPLTLATIVVTVLVLPLAFPLR